MVIDVTPVTLLDGSVDILIKKNPSDFIPLLMCLVCHPELKRETHCQYQGRRMLLCCCLPLSANCLEHQRQYGSLTNTKPGWQLVIINEHKHVSKTSAQIDTK